jgi:hypothetical protein
MNNLLPSDGINKMPFPKQPIVNHPKSPAMNIRQLNERCPITDLLAKEGFLPTHKRGNDWWYLSPIRAQEHTASFKVNTVLNRWFDHGIGEGGKLFDLALRLYPTLDTLQVLRKVESIFSFQQPFSISNQSTPLIHAKATGVADEEKKIWVTGEGPVSSPALVRYLQERGISLEVAQQFCREVAYTIEDRKYYAIGFKNDAGGYELRNPGFKGSSSPKAVTFIDNGRDELMVTEGFFNFLSFYQINEGKPAPDCNFLILNSLSFFEKSRPLMEGHGKIYLLLDNDASGQKWTTQALAWSSRYQDRSRLYHPCKDLNAWLVLNTPRHSLRHQNGNPAGITRAPGQDEPPDKPEHYIRSRLRPR